MDGFGEAMVYRATVCFRPVGHVDLRVVERLRRDWYGLIDECVPDRVIVDLQDVTFMDSQGWACWLASPGASSPAEAASWCATPPLRSPSS